METNQLRLKRISLTLIFSLLFSSLSPITALAQPSDKRPAMDAPATLDQLNKFKEALNKNRQTGNPEKNDQTDASESYATDLMTYVWREPKARYLASAIAIGEVFFATMLWKRMSKNVATWERQVVAVKDVAKNMGPSTAAYAKAEHDFLRSLAAMEAADRAEVLKSLDGTNPRTRAMIEKALAAPEPKPVAPGTTPVPPVAAKPTLPLAEATENLKKTYGEYQTKATSESRVLKAAGRPVPPPTPLAEVASAADARTRAVSSFSHTSTEFHTFKNDGLKHLAKDARMNLGHGVGWKTRVWRKTRTGLLMLALPITVLGISWYYDKEMERNRRLQDLNSAALQDRNKWVNTFVPYFHRPLLYAVVTSWAKVQAKEGSPLKRFTCPYELKEAEMDNPHLQLIQAIAMQTLIEMEEANEDILVENNVKTVIISPRFFNRFVRKLLVSENSPLLNLEAKTLDPIVEDLANEIFHAFDKAEFAPPKVPNDDGEALPPLNLDK